MRSLALLVVLAGSLASCSDSAPGGAPAPSPDAALETPLARLRADTEALMARAEHGAPKVRVQHLLVGVKDMLPGVTRSAQEAEALAAELYARVLAGEDFDTLVKNHTNDEHPGIYAMCLGASSTPGVYAREDMALGFGDVAWRLAVGEVGVTRYDGERFDIEARSPFGYQLVKRLE